MSEHRKSPASRPAFVLVCSAAVILGTVGAWHFLEGPSTTPSTIGAPPFVSPDSRTSTPAAVENGGETREQHRQYALAIELALASDPQQRENAFAMLLPELLSADPAAAVQIMNRQPPGETRDAMRDEMARRWVMQDRESALTWVDTLANDTDRRAAATVAMRTMAAQSPEQAIIAADRFGVGRDDGSLEYIVQIWAETDLDSARRWAQRQPPDSHNAFLRARVEQVAARGEGNRP